MDLNTIANGSSPKQWCEFSEKRRVGNESTVLQFYRVNTDISARLHYVGLMNAGEARSNADLSKGMEEIGGFDHAFLDSFGPNWVSENRSLFHADRSSMPYSELQEALKNVNRRMEG